MGTSSPSRIDLSADFIKARTCRDARQKGRTDVGYRADFSFRMIRLQFRGKRNEKRTKRKRIRRNEIISSNQFGLRKQNLRRRIFFSSVNLHFYYCNSNMWKKRQVFDIAISISTRILSFSLGITIFLWLYISTSLKIRVNESHARTTARVLSASLINRSIIFFT